MKAPTPELSATLAKRQSRGFKPKEAVIRSKKNIRDAAALRPVD